MYLFDKNKETVFIYEANLNQDVAFRFRKAEMEKIDDASCFKFETSKIHKDLERVLDRNKNQVIDVPISQLEYDRRFLGGYHTIKTEEDDKKYLNQYYKGTYNDANIIRVHDYNSKRFSLSVIKYLLVNKKYHKHLNGDAFLEGVISIPQNLYFFELLQKGKFEYLDSADISKFLELFSFQEYPIDQIPLDLFDKFDCYGLGTDTKDNLMSQIQGTQKVIKTARKYGYIR